MTAQDKLDERFLNAAAAGDAAAVDRALEAGAGVYRINPANGWSAMHYALNYNYPDVVRTLVRNDFDPNHGGDEHRAPVLRFGLQAGHKEACDALVEAGANIDFRNEGNKGLLIFCLEHDEHFGIRYLLEKGADPTQALNYLAGKHDPATAFKWSGGTPNEITRAVFDDALDARRKREGVACMAAVEDGTTADVKPLKPLRIKPLSNKAGFSAARQRIRLP